MRVACLGECMLELSTGAATTRLGFGGDTLNTAAYLARELRGTTASVQFITALGTDAMSEDMLSAWRNEGIDTSAVVRIDDALPGFYLIRTDEAGERSFYYWREQAAVRQLFDNGGGARLARTLSGTDVLYLSGITLAIFNGPRRQALLKLLSVLRSDGTRIAFDTNYRPRLWRDVQRARDAYAAISELVDIALPGIDDERALYGELAPSAVLARWQARGASEVVVRCGEAGALAAVGRETTTIAVPELREAVDTTAAGDSFNAAYLAARLRGEGLPEAVMAGHVLAGHVVMHAGAIVAEDHRLREDNNAH